MKALAATEPASTSTGRVFYANMIGRTAPGMSGRSIYLYADADIENRLFLVANADKQVKGRILLFDHQGSLINSQHIAVDKGKNTMEVTAFKKTLAQPRLVAVYLGNELAFMQKLDLDLDLD